MTRRPSFWIAFTIVGVAGVVTAANLFTVALPSIAIDITMDRQEAIASADALAERYGWAPRPARTAASFGQVDPEVQTYVELEGGGRDAFVGLAEAGVYQPYQWRVRRFEERRIEESLVRFTPQGEPYGFELTLPEDDPGTGNLDGVQARAVAERTATEWSVDLASFELVESSAATLPGGRVDHTLVWQRTDVTLADARFRLRVVVAGGRAAELTHYVQVPESFRRRFADMRATNDAIALTSQAVFVFVFVLLGAGVGTALLLRRRWVEWRTPLLWGAVSAGLLGLNTVNMLPLSWMAYDTADAASTFVLRQIAAGVAVGLLGTPLLAFFYMAAESLGRRAFPDHVQQWRLWRDDVASSNTVLGLTLGAYLLAGVELGWVVLFYLGTSRLEGWWSPADALVQPDLLATYVPWLQAVSIAVFAALWEESVFRAVPIACAALLGRRFGRPVAWIWTAVLLQALVFAAGHANYPQQPPYARVVELFLPAVVWGVVYLRFGLLPTILTHFLYDLSLISGVLFASDALLDQGVVVLVGLVPLVVVIRARRRAGARSHPPGWAYNRSWSPPSPREGSSASERGAAPAGRLEPIPAAGGDVAGAGAGAVTAAGPAAADAAPSSPSFRDAGAPEAGPRLLSRPVVYALGALGAAAWIGAQLLRPPLPSLSIGRTEAVAAATTELERRGLGRPSWSVLASAASGRALAHEYVHEEMGPAAYRQLLGGYLSGPHWTVRFVDWEADPVERVEELTVRIGAGGAVTRLAHLVPEARAGASLAIDSARVLAMRTLASRFALDPAHLVEIAAEEMRRPSRTDWLLTFADTTVAALPPGQARLAVRIAGDLPVEARRFVRVPEDWERDRRRRSTRETVVTGGLSLLLALCFGSFAVTAVVVWSRGGMSMAVARSLGGLVLAVMLGASVNRWPLLAAGMSTQQPWTYQAVAFGITVLFVAVVASTAAGLVGALAHAWSGGRARRHAAPAGSGIAVGLAVAGITALLSGLTTAPPPPAGVSGAATFVPALAAPLDAATSTLLVTTAVLALVAAWVRFRARQVLATIVWAVAIAGAALAVPAGLRASPLAWGAGTLAALTVAGAVVRLGALRPAFVPAVVGTLLAAEALESALARPYPGAGAGGALAVLVVAAIAWRWSRALDGAAAGLGAERAGRQ